jgi:tRNA A37 threonylcarbamoyladenosine biosynthesis protein TsaE
VEVQAEAESSQPLALEVKEAEVAVVAGEVGAGKRFGR